MPTMNSRKLRLFGLLFAALFVAFISSPCAAQSQLTPVRVAYSALSAGIGALWLSHEDGYFKKHGLDSNLIYIRGGTMKAGAIHGGILSPPTSTAARDMGYRPLLHIPDLGKEFTFSGIATRRSFVQSQPEIARAFMAALTDGAKAYREDQRAALRTLRKYMRADDRVLEGGYKEYGGAISSPPYPGIEGLEAVRQSLVESTPQLKQVDLRKFIDARFVRTK